MNSNIKEKVEQFAHFTLNTDLSEFTVNQKEMLTYLFEAAKVMDELFWKQAYGEKEILFQQTSDSAVIDFVKINYGPWERLNGNIPFMEQYGPKPAGANFYPPDMTKEEFESFDDPLKNSQYSLLRRDQDGNLYAIAYHDAYSAEIQKASELILKASELAEIESFKRYLKLRSEALLTDQYYDSDMAWMEMKDNQIDFVVGPIENYEDQLFGLKTAYEAYILIKDKEWSDRLAKYAALLPDLQKSLPVEDAYKQEEAGSNSDLGAYDVIFYQGDCNAGSKTIAINLPNDEKVQLQKGSRRLQLKNSMQAKFDKILIPISKELISEDQQKHVTFDAFFANTMFHEVAHGLGIKETLASKQPVREVLKELYSTLEEGKADILGLYMVTKLHEWGEYETNLMDNYVTFMAGIFRSVRFGASSSHGKANLIRYNYFKEFDAFSIHQDGTYSINFENMQNAMNSLSDLILRIQGDGDYTAAAKLLEEKAVIDEQLRNALRKVNDADIPVDIVFNQGREIVGL